MFETVLRDGRAVLPLQAALLMARTNLQDPAMTFHLHDTLTGQIVPLPARTPGHVGIYVCGPTVYNYIHVGNARPAVVFDTVVRHLRASGLQVKFVRNFTDIDDKIIKAAVEANEDPRVFAQRFVDAYLADTGALRCVRPDAEPRVSDHLPEIVELVQTLIARGHAYERDGDVYFSVRTFERYGKLSKRDLDQLRAGERVAVDERKDDALDFALWKAAKPHEPPGARWPSSWGEGRPGWHIECSAMARKHLGDGFDLHGGGLDLIFPHHENEIAQSESATGVPFCHAWMHNGFININDEKMAKSRMAEMGSLAKHFVLRNVLQHVDAEGVRLWLLGTHYRAPLNFELAEASRPDGSPSVRFPGLEEAERRVEYFYETRMRIAAKLGANAPARGADVKLPDDIAAMKRSFAGAMDDDLNTAVALASVADVFKRANEACDAGKRDAAMLPALHAAIAYVTSVLGVAEDDAEAFFARVRARRVAERGIEPTEIDALVQERIDARKAKDFARADEIRARLLGQGIEIRDSATGSSWRVA